MTPEILQVIWASGAFITFIGWALLQRTYPKHDRDGLLETSILAVLWPLAICSAGVGIAFVALAWVYDKLSGAHHD